MMGEPFGFPTVGIPMSRKARLIVPGKAHHIVQRGSRRLNVFRDVRDRLSYIDFFGESCAMYGLTIHAYSLMPNHVHYVAVPECPDSVAKTFHRAHGMYSNWFNEKHELVGHLWQERPFSCVMSEAHCSNAMRYIENNPVRAGLVSLASEYRWSSARAHCYGEPDPLLNSAETGAIPGWADWLGGGNDPQIEGLIRECTFSGRPCGDETFVLELEELTGRKLHPVKRGPKPKVGSDNFLLDFERSDSDAE
jgi:putative transposase